MASLSNAHGGMCGDTNVLVVGGAGYVGSHTCMALGAMHRLENPGRILLEIIEVQTGSYPGEDDIVRVADAYQRA